MSNPIRTTQCYIRITNSYTNWTERKAVFDWNLRQIVDVRANSKVSATTRDYVDGNNSFNTIGFNKASEHYVGFLQGRRVPHTQTQAVPTNFLTERIQRVQDTPVVKRRPFSQTRRATRTHAHVTFPSVLPDVVEAMSCYDIVASIFHNSNIVAFDSYYSSVSPMCTDTVDTHTYYYSTECANALQ